MSPAPSRVRDGVAVDRRAHTTSEKEKVYAELDCAQRELARTRRKCAALKDEIARLRTLATAKEASVLRREAGEYRKALSNLAHRLDAGDLDEETLAHIVRAALTLRGLKAFHRDQIEALR